MDVTDYSDCMNTSFVSLFLIKETILDIFICK